MLANKKPKTFLSALMQASWGETCMLKTSLFTYEKSSLTISNRRRLLGIQAVTVHCPKGRSFPLGEGQNVIV